MLVSFDFDDTLSYNINGVSLPIIENLSIANNLHSKGAELILVTSRQNTPQNRAFVSDALRQFKVDNIFKNIYLVGGIKANHLKQLGVDLHYDNDIEECSAAKLIGVKCIHRPI